MPVIVGEIGAHGNPPVNRNVNQPVYQTGKPLAGKCIVITRAREQSAALAEALERYGAEVLFLPTVAFVPAKDTQPLDAAIKELDQFDWILFTSQNAVRFFSQRRRELGLPPSGSGAAKGVRVAAIGPATAQAAEKEMWHGRHVNYSAELGPPTAHDAEREMWRVNHSARLDPATAHAAKKEMWRVNHSARLDPATAHGAKKEMWRVNYVAKNHTGASLVSELKSSLAGRKVLLPRSDRADRRLLEELRTVGAHATDVVAYSTVAPENLDPEVLRRLRAGEVDAAVFASPSAFHNFTVLLGSPEVTALSSRARFAAIGPTTAQAVRDAGGQVAIEASIEASDESTTADSTAGAAGLVEKIADKIAEYYREHSHRTDATAARRS
jgi:uroporphyrinogen-III synthase